MGTLDQRRCLAADRGSEPYPAALKRVVVDTFVWEAGFAIETARSSADRGDISYVVGCLFRSVSCLVQVLFALNERYLINEKGAVVATDGLTLTVPRFKAAVEEILGCPGKAPAELRESLDRLEGTVTAVRRLLDDAGQK